MKLSSIDVKYEFSQFGSACQLIAIGIILGIIPYVGFIGFIVVIIGVIKALGAIKRVNSQLNNVNLAEWRSKFILSFVVVIIGMILGFIAFIILIAAFAGSEAGLAIAIIWIIFVVILLIISGVIEMKAWENMRVFFEQNKNLFPETLALDGIEASKNLRTAALMRALAFLVITIIIGWIFELIGYFKMANLKNLGIVGAQPAAVPASTAPPATSEAARKFCPNCGAPVTGQEKFCSSCGAEL
jgi:uncharacterized membrane protein